MRFSAWPFLLLLLLIPLLHRFWVNRNRPAKVMFSLPVPAAASVPNPLKLLLVVKYIGLALFIIALARPQASFKETERTVSGIDIMMVLDVSASMNTEDMGDRSRIDIAKDVMENFVKGRQNDRIGFLIFSGEPLTLAPPTLDYGLLMNAIHGVDLGRLKDGTAIGDGLAVAINRLRDSKAKSRVIILLTDGDNNLGQVDPATSGELAAGYGIRVYTIAIGREGRVKVPIKHQGPFGKIITTYQWMENTLNPQLLKEIAQSSHGKFYRVEEEGNLQDVFKEIDKLEKTEVKSTEKVRYEERFDKPLKFGMLALAVERVLSLGWWRLLP